MLRGVSPLAFAAVAPKGATQNLGNLIKSVGSDCIAQQKV